jgi:hypothetical protein
MKEKADEPGVVESGSCYITVVGHFFTNRQAFIVGFAHRRIFAMEKLVFTVFPDAVKQAHHGQQPGGPHPAMSVTGFPTRPPVDGTTKSRG